MAIEIGTVNADTSVKLGSTNIKSAYIGFNQFYNTYTSILDLYPSAYHAFSLRKLKSTYGGFCLRIRRTTTTPSTTTTVVDLSFDLNNTISLLSKITYVSGTATNAKCLGEFSASSGFINVDGVNTNQNIFVVRWYDQSGNNKNTTQATAGSQPRLVNNGVLEESNGKVAVRFIQANSTRLFVNDSSVSFNNMSAYVVGNGLALTNSAFFYGLGSTTRFYMPNGNNISYVTTPTFTGYTNAIGVNRLYELVAGISTTSAYSNGVLLSPASVTSAIATNTDIRIGTNPTASPVYTNGYISEIILFIGATNRTGIETNINSFYSIW